MQRLTTFFNTSLVCCAASATNDLDPRREQRRHTLYQPGFRGSALDARLNRPQALHDATAAALQREVLDGRPLLRAWNDAIANQQPDVLRALLLLTDEHDIRHTLARPQYNAPLHRALPLADAGLAEIIKQYPYQSSKPRPDGRPFGPRNFNGAVPFTPDQPDHTIDCRHLATHVLHAMHAHAGLKFNYRQDFADLHRIHLAVSPETESQYMAWHTNAQETHLIATAQFGTFLTGQFAAMARADQTGKCLMMNSGDHVMGVALRIKNKNGQRWHVVKFYDPNETTQHTRSKARDHHMFATQDLASYLADSSNMRAYFPEPAGIVVLFARPEPTEPAAMATGRRLTSCVADEHVDAMVMHHLLEQGFDSNLTSLKPLLSSMPVESARTLLAAQNAKGLSGFFKAALWGKNDAIRAFGNLLDVLPESMRASLLAAGDADRLTPLHAAMLKSHGDTVRAYRECMIKVPEDQRANLLKARTSRGGPALLNASYHNHADTIRAFAGLLGLIPESQRLALASPTLENGLGGLHVATIRQHAEVILAYADVLKTLSVQDRVLLLAQQSRDGLKGFPLARRDKNPEVIAAWKTLMRLISPDDVRQVVARSNAGQTSGRQPAAPIWR